MSRQTRLSGATLHTWAIVTLVAVGMSFQTGCIDVCGAPVLEAFCSSETSKPITPVEDGSKPLCQGGKRDDGTPCREPEDGGIPEEDATCPDLEPEASPDAETPPTPDTGTPPEPCHPPAWFPDGTYCAMGCTVYWDENCRSDCEGSFLTPGTPEQLSFPCSIDAPV